MNEKATAQYGAFLELIKQIHTLSSAEEALGWDQQVMMPPKGAGLRAEQLSLLTGIIHDRTIDPELVDLVDALHESSAELDEDALVNVREMKRTIDRARKVPRELVQEISKTQSLSHQHWLEAISKSDFRIFAPWMESITRLRREQAEALGYEESPYDPLLDEFEPSMTAREIEGVFTALRPRLVEVVEAIRDSGVTLRGDLLTRTYPAPKQEEFGAWMIRKLGYDFSAGRVDKSAHPFTTGNLHDVRITTRYDESFLSTAIFGLAHEAGHAMYEQGFDPAHEGTPRATSVSLGIHESQSRLWENLVCRSRAFWEFAYPYFQAFFPGQTADVPLEDWYGAINEVKPTLIRVEADEVTYNLHIILRFEIERALLEDRIKVTDLPSLWNEKMVEYLGIAPPNDAQGVLQDIHWSMGYLGYFPTYALGNLYASQFFAQITRDLPDLEDQFRRGEFAPLKEWLVEKIHRPGQTYRAAELVERVTGEPLSADHLIGHLRAKYGPLYGGWA